MIGLLGTGLLGVRPLAETGASQSADTTPPVITLNGSSSINLNLGDTYNELGATWTDNVDGAGNAVVGGDTVNTSVADTYIVTYNYTDAAGNAATQVTRTVTVSAVPVDTTPPVITLIGSATVNHEQGTPYVDQGATASDDTDGNITGDIVTTGLASVDVNTAGTYFVSYDVMDDAGNAATTVIRTIEVADTTAPEITLTGNSTVLVVTGDPYVELGATWTDLVDGSGAAIVGGDVVNTAVSDVYVVTYDITDAAGNVADQVTRTVVVNGIALSGLTRVLNIGDFPATYIPTANDIQPILVRLKKLVRRSRPNVARQIENYVYGTYEALSVTTIVGDPPDNTTPTNINLKIIYGIFADYLRVERIKVNRLLDVSNNATVRHAMARQLQFWLETQGWIFYAGS